MSSLLFHFGLLNSTPTATPGYIENHQILDHRIPPIQIDQMVTTTNLKLQKISKDQALALQGLCFSFFVCLRFVSHLAQQPSQQRTPRIDLTCAAQEHATSNNHHLARTATGVTCTINTHNKKKSKPNATPAPISPPGKSQANLTPQRPHTTNQGPLLCEWFLYWRG